MEERERRIRLWFDMWLRKTDLGIAALFARDAVYTESWGPQYKGREKIRLWFAEWNTRGTVLTWEIKQFIHTADQTVVEWYFSNQMSDGRREEFDGISLIGWTDEGQIRSLKEFGCNLHHYDPYQNGAEPRFREGSAMWF